MMIWKDREIATTGDLVIVLEGLKNRKEARAFKSTYIEYLRGVGVEDPTETANSNLGYCTGYLGGGDLVRLQEWLDVEHPILGRGKVSPEEAFAAGQDWIETGIPWKDRKKELEQFEEELREQG